MSTNNFLRSISEQIVREIWKRQLFQTNNLEVIDGRRTRIVSTGVGNPNGGPDFLGAKIEKEEYCFQVTLSCTVVPAIGKDIPTTPTQI
jgi:hypothetical protein